MKQAILLNFILIFIECSGIVENQPYGETIVVLTFDDAHSSIFQNAYPTMKEFGYVATNYVPTGWVGNCDRLTLDQLQLLEKEGGWETGGHTITHANLTQIDLDSAEVEIVGCWKFLKDHDLKHASFALPVGHSNTEVTKIIKRYFNSIRTSEDFKMKCPIDPFSLGYYDARNTDGSEKINGRILRGISNHECLVIIGFHRIIDNKQAHSRAITPQEFWEILEFIRNRNLRVMTISQAIEQL